MDLLISISLILIVASSLIPALTSSLISRQKLKERTEIYDMAKNQLEVISAASYSGKDDYEIIIDKNLDYSIDKQNLSENLVKYTLTIKDKKTGDLKFEKILQKKSLYSDWTDIFPSPYLYSD